MVDPREVAKFDALAREWWDPKGKFKPLHKFNPVRLSIIRRAICRTGTIDTEKGGVNTESYVSAG